MLKTDPGETVGDKSAFLVSHYIGNENSSDVLNQTGGSLSFPKSDISKFKNVGINWGNLLKAAPAVIKIGKTTKGLRKKSLKLSINWVRAGSSVPKSLKILAKTGIKKIVIPKKAVTANKPTATG